MNVGGNTTLCVSVSVWILFLQAVPHTACPGAFSGPLEAEIVCLALSVKHRDVLGEDVESSLCLDKCRNHFKCYCQRSNANFVFFIYLLFPIPVQWMFQIQKKFCVHFRFHTSIPPILDLKEQRGPESTVDLSSTSSVLPSPEV
jgi:hypothetical protein